MNFDQLKTFYMIAQTGGFTKASRSLYISQSAVSQQIQALEYSLGFKLFDRSTKKTSLTKEGENLFTYTKRLFELYDEITTLSNSHKSINKGKLAFASTRVIGIHHFSKLIGLYTKQFPGVEIYFRLGNSHHVIDLILEGSVDFGIAGQVPNNPRLYNIFLHREKLVAVSSPNHYIAHKNKCAAKDISKVPLVWREKGTQTRMIVAKWFEENTCKHCYEKSIVLEHVEAAKRIVAEGYGMAIVPEIAVAEEINSGRLKQINIEGFNLFVDSYLYYLRSKMFSKATMAFLKLLYNINLFSQNENLGERLKQII